MEFNNAAKDILSCMYIHTHGTVIIQKEGSWIWEGGRGAEEILKRGWEGRMEMMQIFLYENSHFFFKFKRKKKRMNASWLSGIYSRNRKRLPHSKLNQCDSLCEQTQKERKLRKSWTIWEGWRNRWGRGRQEQQFRAQNHSYHRTSRPTCCVEGRTAIANPGLWSLETDVTANERGHCQPCLHQNGFIHILGL